MSEPAPNASGTSGSSVDPRIESVVAEFESAWIVALSGHAPPDLAACLGRIADEMRVTVRDRLLKLDCAYRPRWLSSSGSAGPVARGVERPNAAGAEAAQLEADTKREDLAPTVTSMGAVAWAMRQSVDVSDETADTAEYVPGAFAATTDGWRETSRPSFRRLRIPGYEILGELGRGGMGVVYQARQLGLNRPVALKMILAGDHAGPEQLARFRSEAEAVAQLQHANIVQVYQVGEQNGLPYFSLEFVDGKPLSDECRGIAMLPERAAVLVETVARAIHYAHGQNIVHRDLKPANILLTRDGIPKVTDFGLVKRLEGEAGQTRSGAILGTPSFMAPEQARGENTVTPLVDVYSLGAVLYNLLTGRAPYLAATPVDTVMQVLQSEPVAPSRLQPTTPKDLETICLKCLQKQPEKRYGSAEELAEDLRRFRVGEPIHARPVRLAERIWRWSRRNRRVAVLGVVALLLAAVLTIGGPVVAIIVYQQKQIAVSARKESEANEQSAIRAREDALASERVAVQAKGQAQLNEQKAIESQKVAANQGRLALDTLKSLMSDVQQELENQPRMQPLRRKLLKTALGGLDQVATKGVDVRVKDLTMAGAYRRMGDIYLDLGQSEQAFKAFQACHEITDELHKQKALPNPESNLSFSLSNLGEAARRGGRLPQAKEYLLSALKIRQEWAQAESKNPLLLQNVAETLGRLGNVCLMLGQATEAQRFIQEQLKLREQWLAADAKSTTARQEFAGANSAMGRISLRLGNLPDAERYSDEALQIMSQLSASQPNNRVHRWNTALFHNQLAAVRLMAGRAQQAADNYAQSLDILQKLSLDDPQNALPRRHWSEAHYGIAAAYAQMNDVKSASEHFEASRKLRQQLVDDDPTNLTEQTGLMLALARCGRHQEAAKMARAMSKSHPKNAPVLFSAATGFAVCAAAAAQREPGKDADPGDALLADQYGKAAVETLQSAVEHGYQLTAEVLLDPDLASLRDRPDARELFKKHRVEP